VHELVAKGLDPIYVLHSEHSILVERAVAAIRDAAVPPMARGFNYDVVEGKPSGGKVVALAQTLPMMAERRMVLVRDLGLMPADDAEPLLAYFAKPNPSTVIVALTQKLDKRLKVFAMASKKGWLHVLEAPRQLQPWVRDEAKAKGVAIDSAAISRLVDTVGADLSRLSLAVEQLGLFVHDPARERAGGGARAVTSDDVDDLVADTRERSVFELTDAIGAADRGRALAAVTKLCDQRESAVGVVVMLARHIRQLSLVHVAQGEGVLRGALAGRIGVPPFVVDKLLAQAKRYAPRALASATEQLAIADRALKGDITLDSRAHAFTGPQLKALGRELAERVILEQVVGGIVGLAAR
jgi:DNA polymerase-3 subunit delta